MGRKRNKVMLVHYTLYYYYDYKDLFTHNDINTYINGIV